MTIASVVSLYEAMLDKEILRLREFAAKIDSVNRDPKWREVEEHRNHIKNIGGQLERVSDHCLCIARDIKKIMRVFEPEDGATGK